MLNLKKHTGINFGFRETAHYDYLDMEGGAKPTPAPSLFPFRRQGLCFTHRNSTQRVRVTYIRGLRQSSGSGYGYGIVRACLLLNLHYPNPSFERKLTKLDSCAHEIRAAFLLLHTVVGHIGRRIRKGGIDWRSTMNIFLCSLNILSAIPLFLRWCVVFLACHVRVQYVIYLDEHLG